MAPLIGFMLGIQRQVAPVAIYVVLQTRQALASHITTWNLTKLSISLCGPLEDVDSVIRLHVIVRLVFAYIAIIHWVKISVFIRWSTCETYPPLCHSLSTTTVKTKVIFR